jgi:NDP-sugar pyrophosphorylase family protein
MPALKDPIIQPDAVVLCGGKGTRLRAHLHGVPKILAPVNGVAFIEYVIGYLRSQKITRLILCTGVGHTQIVRYLRGRKDLEYVFSREPSARGTAGALANARAQIRSSCVYVLNGDSLCLVSLARLRRIHLRRHGAVTIVVTRAFTRASLRDFGTVVVDGKGKVMAFREREVETSPALARGIAYMSAGVYCISTRVLKRIPLDKASSLEYDFFPRLGSGLLALPTRARCIDIGTPQRLAQAAQLLRKSV